MCETDNKVINKKYKYILPNGGWGYVIMLSFIIFNLYYVIPNLTFGLIFGKFLTSVGDESFQITIIYGVCLTVQMFSGSVTSYLLRKYSFRTVGLIGAIFNMIGAISTIFAQNFFQMILCFSLLQGIGLGFMLSAVSSSMNSYFTTRLNVIFGLIQLLNVIGEQVVPILVTLLTKYVEFRLVLIVVAALATLNLFSMGLLDPVINHIKKIPVEDDEDLKKDDQNSHCKSYNKENGVQSKPLLKTDKVNNISVSLETKGDNYLNFPKDVPKSIPFIDVDFLKNPTFLNFSFGCSVSFMADLSFNALIPGLLETLEIKTSGVTFMMRINLGFDIAGRLLYIVCSIFYKPESIYVFFIGSSIMAIFRTIFVLENSYIWKVISLAIIGFVRCMITNPMTLILSEAYKDTFPSAFSISMVISGIIVLIYGGLESLIRSSTGSDAMVAHLFTAGNLICIIGWSAEFIHNLLKRESNNRLDM